MIDIQILLLLDTTWNIASKGNSASKTPIKILSVKAVERLIKIGKNRLQSGYLSSFWLIKICSEPSYSSQKSWLPLTLRIGITHYARYNPFVFFRKSFPAVVRPGIPPSLPGHFSEFFGRETGYAFHTLLYCIKRTVF